MGCTDSRSVQNSIIDSDVGGVDDILKSKSIKSASSDNDDNLLRLLDTVDSTEEIPGEYLNGGNKSTGLSFNHSENLNNNESCVDDSLGDVDTLTTNGLTSRQNSSRLILPCNVQSEGGKSIGRSLDENYLDNAGQVMSLSTRQLKPKRIHSERKISSLAVKCERNKALGSSPADSQKESPVPLPLRKLLHDEYCQLRAEGLVTLLRVQHLFSSKKLHFNLVSRDRFPSKNPTYAEELCPSQSEIVRAFLMADPNNVGHLTFPRFLRLCVLLDYEVQAREETLLVFHSLLRGQPVVVEDNNNDNDKDKDNDGRGGCVSRGVTLQRLLRWDQMQELILLDVLPEPLVRQGFEFFVQRNKNNQRKSITYNPSNSNSADRIIPQPVHSSELDFESFFNLLDWLSVRYRRRQHEDGVGSKYL